MTLDEKTLAKAMETSLKEVWKEEGRGTLPKGGEGDRKILFLAISRAVIGQLKKGLLEEDKHNHAVKCQVTIGPATGTPNHTHQVTCKVTEATYKHKHKNSST